MIRVHLVDDHPLMLEGLRLVIEKQPDLHVVGESESIAEALRAATKVKPDVVVMDIRLTDGSGIQAAERLKRLLPRVQVVMLTQNDDLLSVRQSMAAGAAGYVLKLSPIETLITAIRTVADGSMYFDPKIRSLVSHAFQIRPRAKTSPTELSDREHEVLRLLALGNSHKEIAAGLDISVKTVESYRHRACEKLGLVNRNAIIRYAIQQGWLEDPPATMD